MDAGKQPPLHEFQKFVSMGRYKNKGVAVFTSGGDAQGTKTFIFWWITEFILPSLYYYWRNEFGS